MSSIFYILYDIFDIQLKTRGFCTFRDMEYDIRQLVQREPAELAAFLNELINRDFGGLIRLLYRLDISETKLRSILADLPQEDAGVLIASLILEREAQKQKTREQFKQSGEIPEDERW